MLKKIFTITAFMLTALGAASAQTIRYAGVEGLVLAGYQGWFNAEDDGAGLGWKHYEKGKVFEPGNCTIDLWPDVSEYERTYPTPFRLADGEPARVFSSHDASTTDLHFRWMRDYGIDGVFMQRFVVSIRSGRGKANSNHILKNAVDASLRYGRALCVMYDLSGMKSEDVEVLKNDWRELHTLLGLDNGGNECYLRQNGRPLVAVWGAGFDDNRRYGLGDVEQIVDFLREEGCSVLLGVPARWRTLTMDTMPDKRLHDIIGKCDVVHPWFVGRYNFGSYPRFRKVIEDDLAWCRDHGKVYMPVIFPGFSWYNLRGGVAAPLNQIPRLGGRFFWQQVHGAVSAGAQTLYIAMFDEIDEGTAIFKCTRNTPVGESPFADFGDVPEDHYLWLAGEAARALRGETPCTETMPLRK